jgi:hypothetical protein
MKKVLLWAKWMVVVLTLASALAQESRPGFQITTRNLPPAEPDKPYTVRLRAVGGQAPYMWKLLSWDGVDDAHIAGDTGVFTARIRPGAEVSVRVQVTDSSNPPLTYTKDLRLAKSAPLAIRWEQTPSVRGAGISGALRVTNATADAFDLTVIVVAVNETGKAFALRYEHLMLAPNTETPALAFESSLPLGHYTVHADAVAEIPTKHSILRDRSEQPGLVVETQ